MAGKRAPRPTGIRHLGLIPDGNRRYAKERGLLPWQGHEKGASKMYDFVSWAIEGWRIPIVTIYGLSEKNLQRSPLEVSKISEILVENISALRTHRLIHENEVRVSFVGRISRLQKKVQEAAAETSLATRNYSRHFVNICLAYDGQSEIADAVSKGARTAEEIEKGLYLSFLPAPHPDLIIRTSGERRLSGFLLWSSSYSEFFFSDKYWPEFTKREFDKAVSDYEKRNRRFGR